MGNINMNNMLDGRHQQSMSSDRHMSDRQMYMEVHGGVQRNNMMSNVMNHNIYNMNNLDSMNMDNMNMNNMQMRNMENLDDGLLHERNTMAQRVEVERIPENAMTYFYF